MVPLVIAFALAWCLLIAGVLRAQNDIPYITGNDMAFGCANILLLTGGQKPASELTLSDGLNMGFCSATIEGYMQTNSPGVLCLQGKNILEVMKDFVAAMSEAGEEAGTAPAMFLFGAFVADAYCEPGLPEGIVIPKGEKMKVEQPAETLEEWNEMRKAGEPE
jgi:hypothetical protein